MTRNRVDPIAASFETALILTIRSSPGIEPMERDRVGETVRAGMRLGVERDETVDFATWEGFTA